MFSASNKLLARLKRPQSLPTNPLVALIFCAVASLLIYAFLFVHPANLLRMAPLLPLESDHLYVSRPGIQIRIVLGFLSLSGFYILGWRMSRRLSGRAAWMIVLGSGLGYALVLLFMYPFGAADIFDNILHGRLAAFHGGNPYVPDIDLLEQDPFFAFAAWKRSPSAYGPLWEGMSALVAGLVGSGAVTNILAFKLLPGMYWVASLAVVTMILNHKSPDHTLSGVVLLGWNPLVLYETWGNGHNDMAMVFWMLLAVLALVRGWHVAGIVFLVAGALVKFIPVLLLPAAVLISLRRIRTFRARIVFLIIAGLASVLLIGLAYRPFWTGVETLSVGRRIRMFTTSLPAVVFKLLKPSLGTEAAGGLVSAIAAMVTLVFAIWQGWLASKKADWIAFPQAAFTILMFYLLLTCPWFQGWYLIWPLAFAAVLPSGRCRSAAIFFSLYVIVKYMILGPLLLWQNPWPPEPQLEIVFTLGVMGIPWVYTLVCLVRRRKERLDPRRPGGGGTVFDVC